jgi:lysozyme
MINKAAENLIKDFEKCKLKAYRCPAGVWTIGWGTTAAADVGITPCEGMVITQAQADKYFDLTIDKFIAEMRPAIKRPMNENEHGAFVSLAYNIGTPRFNKSSALRYFNAGDTKKAAEAILLWNKADGKVSNGLIRRRAVERTLFLTPVGFAAQDNDEDARATPDAPRDTPLKSTTMQAGAVQAVSAVGAGASAVSMLDGTAQIVALVFCGVVALAAAWIMRERLRKWADGDR